MLFRQLLRQMVLVDDRFCGHCTERKSWMLPLGTTEAVMSQPDGRIVYDLLGLPFGILIKSGDAYARMRRSSIIFHVSFFCVVSAHGRRPLTRSRLL